MKPSLGPLLVRRITSARSSSPSRLVRPSFVPLAASFVPLLPRVGLAQQRRRPSSLRPHPSMSRRSAAPQQEESIYNLIPAASTAASRPSLYRSRFPHDTPPTGSTFGRSPATAHVTTNLAGEFTAKPGTHRHKQAGASFGPKNAHYSDPTQFQTANAQPELPQRQ